LLVGIAMWDVQDLFRQHSRDLTRFLRRRVSSPEVAADLTQELFLKLIASNPNAAVHDRRGYLFRAASNLAINHNRREKFLAFDDPSCLDTIADEAPSAERHLLWRQELAIVVSVLAEVPPIQREIFLLSRLDGLTYTAIGERLAMPMQTVYSHMVRILLRLQTRFENFQR
jgi:RNA polymerase sigma-70 factor (ECF subfamily)